jgi:Zn-dependent protease with chaperone function
MPVFLGVVESRWAPRSSKSVAGRTASRGGFDSHSLPLHLLKVDNIDMDQPKENQNHQGEIEALISKVSQVLDIDQYKIGSSRDKYQVRFEGMLSLPSEQAYNQLETQLAPDKLMPLFRAENGRHIILIRHPLDRPQAPRRMINYILFLVTFLSILGAGILTVYNGPDSLEPAVIWIHARANLGQAFAFAVSMLAILTAHEFGHYFAARYHKTRVTLPFFIPFPLSPFGTMGAFIRLLEPPRNKKVLLDIGLAGPLAGLVVTIPILVLGLSMSTVENLPAVLPARFGFEGNSILYLVIKYLVHGNWLPQPASFGGRMPILYWIQFFFTGTPLPSGGVDVSIHPVAWAGWAGLLITSLNLLPAGQLDGGHLIYSLFGKRLKWIRPLIIGVLFVLGFMWTGWWLWSVLILLLGKQYAEPLDDITELNSSRKALARFGLVIFFLIFMPVPLILV